MSFSRLLPSGLLWRRSSLSGTLLGALSRSRPLLHHRSLSLGVVLPSASKEPPVDAVFIPEPPPSIPELLPDQMAVFNNLGEPTFQSLGLGTSYFPSDFFLNLFEALHVNAELPWWMVIGATTLGVRLCLFPLIVYHRKKSILFQNNMPTMKKLQERLQNAQMQNNVMEMMHVHRELESFMKRNEMTSMKNLFVLPGVNIAVLLSCLYALRSMANYPVASLQEGGLFWFTDLCLPDPYFALPALCCGTMYLIFFIGADVTKLSSAAPAARYIMTGFPILGFFFIMNLPSALTYYFVVANSVSLLQTSVLKLPQVQKYFDMPPEVHHKTETKKSGPGFMQTFKDGATRAKMLKMVQERERMDDERFRKAGTAPVQKTRPWEPPQKKVEKTEELRKA